MSYPPPPSPDPDELIVAAISLVAIFTMLWAMYALSL